VIEEVYCYQFRNLATMRLAVDAKQIILVGANGAGKSNFLEAIYYLCLGSSFREHHDERLVMFERDAFALLAKHRLQNFHDTIKIQWKSGGKRIWLNDVMIRDRKELLERYPCIAFSYYDIWMITGEPSLRRQFFDQVVSLMYGEPYLVGLRGYQNLLKQRNSAYKQEQRAFIGASVEQFISINYQVSLLRRQMLGRFNTLFRAASAALLGMELYFSYHVSIKGDDEAQMAAYVQEKSGYEWQKRSVLFGVHRDRYVLMPGDKEIASYLSIGQRRMASLLMKQIVAKLVIECRQQKPIMLIDDVFVELDNVHKELFWQMLPAYEQLFMSVLPHEESVVRAALPTSKAYAIEKGQMRWLWGR